MPSLPVVRPSFSFIVAASAVLFASGALAEPVKSEPAARFIDSIGANVHPCENYERHHDVLKKKLGELGVRHVRDGTTPKSFRLAMSFYKAHGIKTTFITGRRVGGEKEWSSPLRPEGIIDELNGLCGQALAATAAIEGPNEYDLHSDQRDPDWPATLQNYQRLVFTHANEDPAPRPLPVIGPSLTSEEAYRKVGDLDA